VGELLPLEGGKAPAKSPGRALTKKQREEISALLQAALDEAEIGTATKAFATAASKRSWIKRGCAAMSAAGDMIEHCPAAERPFFEYADKLHQLALRKMFALGDSRSRGDFRVYAQFLETVWREEYGKKDGLSGGIAVVIVERPPRD
jgi:hypothetical protein